MKKKEIESPVLLTFTPRENELFKEIPSLIKENKFPEKKVDIFRRGFHAVRQLVEVDEKPLLELLVEKLESAQDLDKKNIDTIKALSNVIYATFIAKRGILGAEAFESIPLMCRYLDLIEKDEMSKTDGSKIVQDVATSVKTVFLKPTSNDPSNRVLTTPI